eukprot:TRINITY_DN63505_c0_g1_i1.p1 TRINITY_DN63505_c0_g1~~TRINITY_DN63505_c0_g1_i1.p1  ORF type:complete len:255 (+),score=22.44 TRINITY_DN63505_c0_g1_i1:59-823(+)
MGTICDGVSMICYVFGLGCLVGGVVVMFLTAESSGEQDADGAYAAVKELIQASDAGQCTLGSALVASPNCTVAKICSSRLGRYNSKCGTYKDRATCKCPVELVVPSSWSSPAAFVIAHQDFSIGAWDSNGRGICETELAKSLYESFATVSHGGSAWSCGPDGVGSSFPQLDFRIECFHESAKFSVSVPCLRIGDGTICMGSKETYINRFEVPEDSGSFWFDYGYGVGGALLAAGVVSCTLVFFRRKLCPKCAEE